MVGIYSEKTNQGDGINNEAIRNALVYLTIRTIQDRNKDLGGKRRGVGGALMHSTWDSAVFGVYDAIYSSYIEGGKKVDLGFTSFSLPTIRDSSYQSDDHRIAELEYYIEKWLYVGLVAWVGGMIVPGTTPFTQAEWGRYATTYAVRAAIGVFQHEGVTKFFSGDSSGKSTKEEESGGFFSGF